MPKQEQINRELNSFSYSYKYGRNRFSLVEYRKIEDGKILLRIEGFSTFSREAAQKLAQHLESNFKYNVIFDEIEQNPNCRKIRTFTMF